MIFIKKLLFVLPVVLLLISCAEKHTVSPFVPDTVISAVFTNGEKSWDIEITVNADRKLIIVPKDFPDYKITFSKDETTLSFKDIEFHGKSDLFSVFAPVYEMYLDSFKKDSETIFNYSKKNTLESIVHSSGCTVKDIK